MTENINLSSINKGNVLIIGKRKSGKTTIMNKLCVNKTPIYSSDCHTEDICKDLPIINDNDNDINGKCTQFDDMNVFVRELVADKKFMDLVDSANKHSLLNVFILQSLGMVSPTFQQKMDYVIICCGNDFSSFDKNLIYNRYIENTENDISFETFSNLFKRNDYILIDKNSKVYSVNYSIALNFA